MWVTTLVSRGRCSRLASVFAHSLLSINSCFFRELIHILAASHVPFDKICDARQLLEHRDHDETLENLIIIAANYPEIESPP